MTNQENENRVEQVAGGLGEGFAEEVEASSEEARQQLGETQFFEHNPEGDYVARFSDRDEFRHDSLLAVFSRAIDMYEERDHLSGDRPVAVTIGEAGTVDFPEVDWHAE